MNRTIERRRQAIAEAQRLRDEDQRELERLFRRRAELRQRRAPKEMLRRYDLEIMDLEHRVNERSEMIFNAQNRLTAMALAEAGADDGCAEG